MTLLNYPHLERYLLHCPHSICLRFRFIWNS